LFGGAQPLSLEGNAVRQLDLFLFGENHLYHGYGIPFDPEGLLSTLPALVNVLLGYFAGKLIDETTSREKVVVKLATSGLALFTLALLWNPFFPINKPIWSSSYVLLTCGLAAVLLATLIWLVDIKGLKTWAQPFLVYGMNPLFIYVLADIWANLLWLIKLPDGTSIQQFIYAKLLLPWAGEYLASFLFALHLAIIFWIIALILYRRKIFIKL
ncbi:MAG: acyltransferase family protein, partial [Mangrovibacterium sp.]